MINILQLNRHNVNVFSNEWFDLHHKLFIKVLNTQFVGSVFRELLWIDTKAPIYKLSAGAFHYVNADKSITAMCFTYNRVAKAFMTNFGFIFNLLHEWDKVAKWSGIFVGDRYLKYDFGFSTLDAYSTASKDGYCRFYSSVGATMAYARANASADEGWRSGNVETVVNCGFWAAGSSGNYNYIGHMALSHDTSSLGASATLTSATLYATVNLVVNGSGMGVKFCVIKGSPNDITSAPNGEWGNQDWTRYSNSGVDIPVSGSSNGTKYNWTLNATGVGSISLTGTSKLYLGTTQLADNTTPTWISGDTCAMFWRSGDYTGTASDPYLSIVYTIPYVAPTQPRNMYL